MALIFHSGLLKDISSVLNDADDFNVIIQVGENQNMKEFYAHSVILRARSSYFKSALSANWITKKNDMIIFNKPNISPTVFEMILRYIYTGELDLSKQACEDILKLLVASDELLLEELSENVQDYLIKKQQTWIQQNFVLVLNYIFNLPSCKKLCDHCFKSICKDPQPLINSKNFPSLDKDILFDLFKRDDLWIKEIVVWDCLIKWGIEQADLETDRSKWGTKDYEALKETLSQFIPLIRFADLFPTDFYDKVRPYKAIISNNIYEEIEEFYKFKIGNFESSVIKPYLAHIIVKWIDGKDYKYDTNYKFNLIYRGSRDGINNISFRNKCKGRVASLVLIKVKETEKIFGGYSSIGFSSIGSFFVTYGGFQFYHSSNNFIFSFKDNEDTQNMKISRVVNNYKAILDHDGIGFNFGQGSLSMKDQTLYVHNNKNCSNYENNFNSGVYTIDEIETFVVFKGY